MYERKAIVAALAVGSVTVMAPVQEAGAEWYGGICHIDSDQPLTGFGGVGGNGHVYCPGSSDGIPDLQGGVILEYTPVVNGTWLSVADDMFGVDFGSQYTRTAFKFGSESGYYRTKTCVANSVGYFCDYSSVLKV